MTGEILLVIAGICAILLIIPLYLMHKKKKNKYQVKVKFKPDKKRGYVKPLIAIIFLIMLLGVITYIGHTIFTQSYLDITNKKNSLELELNILESKLDKANNQLIEKNNSYDKLQTQLIDYQNYVVENRSMLQELKSGDKYQLHDPTYSEVIEFLEDFSITESFEMVNYTKNQGIRCAYVHIRLTEGMYELIGFNTIDQGMIYFEPETLFRVNPEIGKDYFLCVEGQPYDSNDEYIIEDILLIW
jgi:hypothetical protein